MYTILVNDNKDLTTSVRTTLLRHSTTDSIQFLYNPPTIETSDNVSVIIHYTGVMNYKGDDDVIKTETLIADEELYKGKARLIIPAGSQFFNNRGRIEVWVTINMEIIINTIDETTGEIINTETENRVFCSTPTVLFIDEVPHENCHRKSDNTISITRGDSLAVSVTLTDSDGYPYTPVEGDVIYFRVKKSASAANILIEKQIDPTTLTIELVEADTENLAFGEYRYEVEIVAADQNHYTVIKNAPFIITEELH